MKKIKEIWDNQRIVLVLSLVIIICFIIILLIGFKLFVGVNTSPYGDRLENVSEHPFVEEDKNNVISKLQENEVVKDVAVRVQGKIVYIQITFEGVTLDKAKEIANSSLESITEEMQGYYDLEYILLENASEENPGFTIMGAKNINRSGIIWNNNTPYEIETEENDE